MSSLKLIVSWTAIIAVGVSVASHAGAQESDTMAIQHGLSRANMDTTCAACTDFDQYANGGWMKSHTIPPTESMWGTYVALINRTQTQLHQILEDDRANHTARVGSDVQKIGTYYGTCMDSAGIETAGLKPLMLVLDHIAAIRTAADVKGTIAELHRLGVPALFRFGGSQDLKHADQVIATVAQGGLGMPNRDYYTRTDAKSRELQAKYVDHVARMLELSGESVSDAKNSADRIMALETQLAQTSLTSVQQRDPNVTYHKMPVSGLQALTPDFDWSSYLKAIGAPSFTVINVRQPDFFKAMDGLLGGTPIETWKEYMKWHVLSADASALPSAFVNEDFRYTQNLTGLKEMLPRWRRCLAATSSALADALGQEYVRRNFTPEAKARAKEMVDNLQAALHDRIEALTWMSPSTKREALAKLAATVKKIGYPDKWKDYAKLNVTSGPFLDNLTRSRQFQIARDFDQVGKPVDRMEWGLYAFTVDANADFENNQITFPAGFMQPPLFDPTADDAVNYGAMGATIGHEMTHLFDDEGRQFDAHGNLRDWWTPQDAANYKERAKRVVDQFNAYTILGDSSLHVNGQLTQGENIADLGGLKIAYLALEKALGKKGRPGLINGFTPEQRFFLSWAQFWRRLVRPEYLRTQINTDPHAPWNLRINGPLSNMPEFAKAFNCKPGDPMVRSDSLRAQIW